MIMTTWQGIVTVLMAVLGTIITRFLPFMLFPGIKEAAAYRRLSRQRASVRHDRTAGGVFA